MPAESSAPAATKMQFLTAKKVGVVGMPLCEGQDIKGVEQGPQVLRENGLKKVISALGWEVHDHGDISTAVVAAPLSGLAEVANPKREIKEGQYTEEDVPHAKVVGSACYQGFKKALAVAEEGEFLLTLGGDHSLATATISAMLTKYPELVVIWVDAHGDINTPESSPSKHYHGMPVAHVMNLFAKEVPGFEWLQTVPFLPPPRLSFIGLRDIDDTERPIINDSGVHAFCMKAVDRLGIAEVVRRALASVDPEGNRPIHLSFDIDACEPAIAPGTGTRARGGLSYREAHYICETLHETGRLVSMDLVEVNPEIDLADEILHGDTPLIDTGATKTVRLGLELIGSALGKCIL